MLTFVRNALNEELAYKRGVARPEMIAIRVFSRWRRLFLKRQLLLSQHSLLSWPRYNIAASYCAGYTCCNCIPINEHFERKKMAVSRKRVCLSIDVNFTCQEQKHSFCNRLSEVRKLLTQPGAV